MICRILCRLGWHSWKPIIRMLHREPAIPQPGGPATWPKKQSPYGFFQHRLQTGLWCPRCRKRVSL